MPLPPVADNFAARLFLDYTSVQKAHVMKVHLPVATGPGAATSMAEVLAACLATRMFTNDAVTGARFSEAGTNFTVPLPFDSVAGVVTIAGSMWQQDPESTFLSLPGRSQLTARKALITFFTAVSTSVWPSNNRYEQGDSATVDTFRENLVSVLSGALGTGVIATTKDGTVPRWYQYMNISQSGYWQRKQRRSG